MLVVQKRNGTPPKELIENWKRMTALQVEMGQTVLRLMEHPDSTLEQLWSVRLRYEEQRKSFHEMRQHLRKIFPDKGYYVLRYPWNQ